MIINFDYVDAKGNQSSRLLYVLDKPVDKYFGIDLSKMDDDEMEQAIDALDEVTKMFDTKMKETIEELKLKGQFRYFKPERMEGMEEI